MRTQLLRSVMSWLVLAALFCLPAVSSAAEIASQKTIESWAYISVSGVQHADLERISTLAKSIRGVEYAIVHPDPKEEPNTLVIRKAADADWTQVMNALTTILRTYRSERYGGSDGRVHV